MGSERAGVLQTSARELLDLLGDDGHGEELVSHQSDRLTAQGLVPGLGFRV